MAPPSSPFDLFQAGSEGHVCGVAPLTIESLLGEGHERQNIDKLFVTLLLALFSAFSQTQNA